MRPFADSDVTVRIAWYPAAKGAAHLPYPSAFMSEDWNPAFPEKTGVGEVYGASRTYNRRTVNPNATGQHICGTADQWAGRATYDPTANVPYNRDGIPLCCGAAELPRGGVMVGGRAAVGYTPPPDRGPGGVLIGGSAEVSYSPPGSSCATAIPATEGVEAVGTVGPTGDVWFTFPVPSSAVYNVTASLVPLPPGGESNIYFGSCDGLIDVAFSAASSITDNGNTYVPATYFVRIYNPSAIGTAARMLFVRV